MTISAVLFDKDGTLIDFDATFAPATKRVIEAVAGEDTERQLLVADAVSFDLERVVIADKSPLIAETGAEIAAHFAMALGITPSDQFALEIDRMFGEACAETVIGFPFLNDTLKSLDAMRIGLGILTNDAEANAARQMEKLGALSSFSFVCGYDSGFGGKPSASPVLAGARHFDVRPEHMMMVGDSIHDLEAAKNAGAIAVAVLSGPAARDDLSPLADYVLDDISALPALISDLKETVAAR